MEILDLLSDEARLVVLRVAGEADDLFAVALRGPQLLVLAVEVVADDRVCRAEDVLRRAVVLLELHDLSVREVAFELDDVSDVGTAERVDRLVGVADDREARAWDTAEPVELTLAHGWHHALDLLRLDVLRELTDERVLRVVRVLVLVDEDVPEPALIDRGDVGMRAEQLHGLPDEVVEVEGVCPLQLLLVRREDLSKEPLARVARVRGRRVVVRVGELVLELGDLRARVGWREAVGVGVELFDDALEERARVGRVVDREAGDIAEALCLAPQDPHARRVERRHPHALDARAEQRPEPLAHLGCCLVRKRDREDLAWPGLLLADEVRDAVREHPRLAGARAQRR